MMTVEKPTRPKLPSILLSTTPIGRGECHIGFFFFRFSIVEPRRRFGQICDLAERAFG